MYHEHPLKILKNSEKNIWLLIFPLIRGIHSFTLDFNALYTWVRGAWFDILVILGIILFGFFRWHFTWINFDRKNIVLISGVFVNKEIKMPYKNISSVTTEETFYIRPFKAVKVNIDTCAGAWGKSDMSLFLKKEQVKQLQQRIPGSKQKGETNVRINPKWYEIVFFSFVFSSSLSGIVYIVAFLLQSRNIAMDIIENELEDFIEFANSLAAKIALGIPPTAVALALIILITWLLSFISNMFRYAKFTMSKGRRILKVDMGILTKRHIYLVPDKINYVDLRQSVIMKFCKAVSVNISCSGYGNKKNELPVLLPVQTPYRSNETLDMLGFGKYVTKNRIKPKMALFSYIWIPLVLTLLIIVAAIFIYYFFESFSRIVVFFAIMAAIPCIWFLIAKIVACFTSGVSIENNFCCVRFSKGFTFHTILADKEKIAKLQIIQNPIDKKTGRCKLDFYLGSELPKKNRIKGIRIEDAKKIENFIS